jgi:hypothetical protein
VDCERAVFRGNFWTKTAFWRRFGVDKRCIFCGSNAAFAALIVGSTYLGFADVHLKHDKILHTVAFLLLSVVFYWIIDTSRKRCINLTLITCTLLGGVGSEFLQALLPVCFYSTAARRLV